MASKTDLVRQFTDAQTSRDAAKIDAVAELLADDIVMGGGRMGEISGKAAILDRLKNPPQMGGGGGGMMGQIQWSEPVEEGSTVKLTASTPMGSLVRTFTFDGDKIKKIEFARA
jgi:hypothetical protein